MQTNQLYSYIHKQIPVMMVLSLFPGLGYIFLGWLNDILLPAVFWYCAVLIISFAGYRLYKQFDLMHTSELELERWYKSTSILFYLFFVVWLVIFLLYAPEHSSGMHYIAIFTEIGASTVAAAILFPDKKLYRPIIFILIIPLVIFFALIGTWYGYVLSVFASIFGWVLLYVARGSNELFAVTSFQSTHDFLTGIYNRQYFVERLQKKINIINKYDEYSFMLLIDLDHFKSVNDSLGHDIGDELLKDVVERIENNLPERNIVARLGGDEFIIIGNNFPDKHECKVQALNLAERMLAVLKATYVIENHHLYISASIGISLLKPSTNSALDFIKEADIAMYEVKDKGRDGAFFFDEEMSDRVEYSLKLERALHTAIEQNEIYLTYQPQVNERQEVMGAEVLARWKSDSLGQVSPVEFITIAEQTGIIVELGTFIIESAFKTLKDWHENKINIEHISINISVRQFLHHNFLNDVTRLTEQYLNEVTASKVIFEITESVVADSIDIVTIINKVKKLGIRFSMDDFGTGYSSLSYIRKLPIDEIKIDRHFINELSQYKNAEEMVNTIIHIAEIFNLKVVAEGVETKEQQQFLIEHGCKVFQGYLYARPLEKEAFEQFYLQQSV